MFASPAGKITISPACRRTAGSGPSTTSAQQVPSVTTWKPITRSAAPITCSPILSALGLSVANGDGRRRRRRPHRSGGRPAGRRTHVHRAPPGSRQRFSDARAEVAELWTFGQDRRRLEHSGRASELPSVVPRPPDREPIDRRFRCSRRDRRPGGVDVLEPADEVRSAVERYRDAVNRRDIDAAVTAHRRRSDRLHAASGRRTIRGCRRNPAVVPAALRLRR